MSNVSIKWTKKLLNQIFLKIIERYKISLDFKINFYFTINQVVINYFMGHFMCLIFIFILLFHFWGSIKQINMKQMLSIVPDSFLDKLSEKQDQIIDLLKSTDKLNQNEFLTEKEARDLLQKKTTWFWKMRKDGLLPFRKIGKSIYYSKKEINQLLENSKQK